MLISIIDVINGGVVEVFLQPTLRYYIVGRHIVCRQCIVAIVCILTNVCERFLYPRITRNVSSPLQEMYQSTSIRLIHSMYYILQMTVDTYP